MKRVELKIIRVNYASPCLLHGVKWHQAEGDGRSERDSGRVRRGTG